MRSTILVLANCLSWITFLKRESEQYSESRKELASLPTFSAMRERLQGAERNLFFKEEN